MKIAVIGTGKTGSKVAGLLGPDKVYDTFNTDNRPTAEKLSGADASIIFVPGEAVRDIHDAVIDSGVPAIWATTGYDWPAGLNDELEERGICWVKASNFSLGMNIVRRCLKVISEGSELLQNPRFSIHEIHHTDKLDAPSGTALSWEKWLEKDAEITSERKGDIKGIHQLHMQTDMESIYLRHEAHDRALFAEGAIWAAEQVLHGRVSPGFHDFSDIFDRIMFNK